MELLLVFLASRIESTIARTSFGASVASPAIAPNMAVNYTVKNYTAKLRIKKLISNRRIIATSGVISIMPIRGTIRRSGDRIGLVISSSMRMKILYGLILNQDRIARTKIAPINIRQK